MPIYEFGCVECNWTTSGFYRVDEEVICPLCKNPARKLISLASVIIPSNLGRKLKTRVALDDELKKQGRNVNLFTSPERKDFCRWALKKEGMA